VSGNHARAFKNKQIRQEELREKLAAQCGVQHALNLIEKIEGSTEPFDLQKYKASFDCRMKLINKYLPELKATEISGDVDKPLRVSLLEFDE